MNDFFKNASPWIGIFGFIFSVINMVYLALSKQKKLSITIEKYHMIDFFTPEKLVCLFVRFENQSQLPISITRMQLLYNNKQYDSLFVPHPLESFTRRKGKEVLDKKTIYSTTLPVNLSSLGAYIGYVAFPVPQNSLSDNETKVTLRICTNRGKEVEKTFLLCESYLLY